MHHKKTLIGTYITVMNVDIDIQDPLVNFEEFQYGQDDIVDVTKPRGLTFLGVVKASRPVAHNIRLTRVQTGRTLNASTRVQQTKLVESIKNRTVVSDVESTELPIEFVAVVGCDHL